MCAPYEREFRLRRTPTVREQGLTSRHQLRPRRNRGPPLVVDAGRDPPAEVDVSACGPCGLNAEVMIRALPGADAVPAAEVLGQILNERRQSATSGVETQHQRLCCQPVARQTDCVLDHVIRCQVGIRGVAIAEPWGYELDPRLSIPAAPSQSDRRAVPRHVEHGAMIARVSDQTRAHADPSSSCRFRKFLRVLIVRRLRPEGRAVRIPSGYGRLGESACGSAPVT